MSILITGAEGFVGRNLAELFLKNNYPVLAPKLAELDLTDAEAVKAYLSKNPVEAIVHSATVLMQNKAYPTDTCEKNLRMFFNLLRHKAPGAKLITLGSGSEYDRRHWQKKMREDYFDEHIPADGHSYAKYLISKHIGESADESLVCLRLFGIFGRYEDYRYKFISNAIVKNLAGLPIVINQNVAYDYLYINDFFRIVEHFVKHKPKSRIFNATPTSSIDLVSIANLINQVGASKSEIKVLNNGLGVEYSGDNTKLLAELGDFKFLPYSEAIADLYSYYTGIKDQLDIAAVKQDDFLTYAKKLHSAYFDKK
ncbi:MAG TPA: epimerase [Elusimicrobia bacterium]|nr:MAG: hypothetical protein A2016_09830 [Elusimicrobia bacterium GWF2_62_30]HBA60788.1 epimerase [Elusimicrobiota bacterium]